ncbi:MAG: DUF2237 domain-containing protein [Planctomycetota bacterium]
MIRANHNGRAGGDAGAGEFAGGPEAAGDANVNVLGGDLQPCSMEPLTGFYRNGKCQCGAEDVGVHAVCAVMTAEFLTFSKHRGNDLSTPRPEWGFPGLQAGDRWCLCAGRWVEAERAGVAPKVVLEATSQTALEYAPLEVLRDHAVEA